MDETAQIIDRGSTSAEVTPLIELSEDLEAIKTTAVRLIQSGNVRVANDTAPELMHTELRESNLGEQISQTCDTAADLLHENLPGVTKDRVLDAVFISQFPIKDKPALINILTPDMAEIDKLFNIIQLSKNEAELEAAKQALQSHLRRYVVSQGIKATGPESPAEENPRTIRYTGFNGIYSSPMDLQAYSLQVAEDKIGALVQDLERYKTQQAQNATNLKSAGIAYDKLKEIGSKIEMLRVEATKSAAQTLEIERMVNRGLELVSQKIQSYGVRPKDRPTTLQAF